MKYITEPNPRNEVNTYLTLCYIVMENFFVGPPSPSSLEFLRSNMFKTKNYVVQPMPFHAITFCFIKSCRYVVQKVKQLQDKIMFIFGLNLCLDVVKRHAKSCNKVKFENSCGISDFLCYSFWSDPII